MIKKRKSEKNIMIFEPKCPYCHTEQIDKSTKSWEYGVGVTVNRFLCKCGRTFNYYKSPNMTWTIPKPEKPS